MESGDLAAKHFANFIYRRVARHWHSRWVRWQPDGTLKQAFQAERIFEPTKTEGGEDAVTMRVIYHYGDERGTVSEGPQCGPWTITEAQHSRGDGMAHPSSPDSMTTLLLPGGPSAWCMKQSPEGAPCALEMFLHHTDLFRVSFGVIHAPDGALQQLSIVREDTRGPWPRDDWPSTDEARMVSAAELEAALASAGAPTATSGTGAAITASLVQDVITSARWSDVRVANVQVDGSDAVLLCDRFAIVAPRKVAPGQPWRSAAAWWPESGVLYTIEAAWDAQGDLEGIRTLTFRQA